MSSLTFPPEHESEMPHCKHGRAIESVCEFCDGEKIEALEARVEVLEGEKVDERKYLETVIWDGQRSATRVAELEARLYRRNERIRDLQKCQDRLRELDKAAQGGEGGV